MGPGKPGLELQGYAILGDRACEIVVRFGGVPPRLVEGEENPERR